MKEVLNLNDIMTVKASKPYPIYFRDSFEDLKGALNFGGKICIITDSNVAPLYLKPVQEILGNVPAFIFEAGEANKNMQTLQDIYSFFLENKMDRRSVAVALGGGVAGDICGLAAATYMRGIKFVQVPTSLLAQVDASVGGKTAVDFGGVKNLIGAFHQPSLVYINVRTLETLPEEEFASGMGEVIKHGLIGGQEYFNLIQESVENPGKIAELVKGSCEIKAKVVEADEKEGGLREILNFGHCVGHAIESVSGYSIPHGHSVALGMCAALYISNENGNITDDEVEQAISLMEEFGLPTNLDEYEIKDIISEMFKDKKVIDNKLRIVLLNKLGEAYTAESVAIGQVEEALGFLYA